jgi:quinol monooxygenase YgiN
MSDTMSWNLRLRIADGKQDEALALANDMSRATLRDEPGTLIYEWFVSDDGTHLQTYERFADNDATLAHLGNFGANFAGRFMEVFSPVSLDVYGSASSEVREGLAVLGATHLREVSGFAR